MSRLLRGQDVLDRALQAIASATTIEQLRQAQAVVPAHAPTFLVYTGSKPQILHGMVE
jgi:hypothetical protein